MTDNLIVLTKVRLLQRDRCKIMNLCEPDAKISPKGMGKIL